MNITDILFCQYAILSETVSPLSQPPECTDLVHRPLAATASDAHAVDDVALLGLVAHAASLVGARGARQAHNAGHLAVLPAANAQEEAEHIALLLPPQLLNVLQGHEEA